MSTIPDFTETELWIVKTSLRERYGEEVDVQLTDVELGPDPATGETSACPAVFWSRRGANFRVAKTAEKEYCCQFYYRGFEGFDTGRDRYDDLAECLTAVLQAQADHGRKRAGAPLGRRG